MSLKQPSLRRRLSRPSFLSVVEQPPSAFYKDEGGKSNYMSVVVRFDESSGGEFPGTFALKAALYFESEEKVAEESILTIIGNQYEPPILRSANDTATFNFRIEKVSRRKDGQRFKLFIEPDYKVHPAAKCVSGTFTCPIAVLSKRKVAKGEGSSDSKRRKVDPALEQRMGIQISDLQTTCFQLMHLLQSQNDRMMGMERTLGDVLSALKTREDKKHTHRKLAEQVKDLVGAKDLVGLNMPRMPRMPLTKSLSGSSTASSTSGVSSSSTASTDSATKAVPVRSPAYFKPVVSAGSVGTDSDHLSPRSQLPPPLAPATTTTTAVVNSAAVAGLPPPQIPVRARLHTFGSTGSLLNALGGCGDASGTLELPGEFKMDKVTFSLDNSVALPVSGEAPTKPSLRGTLSSGFEFTFDY